MYFQLEGRHDLIKLIATNFVDISSDANGGNIWRRPDNLTLKVVHMMNLKAIYVSSFVNILQIANITLGKKL